MGRKADAAITFGLIGATAAAVTGLADWSKVGRDRPRRIGLAHGLLNIAASCLLYDCRSAFDEFIPVKPDGKIAMAGFMISNLSAYLGGHLVYSEKIGVDHTAGFSPPEDFSRFLPKRSYQIMSCAASMPMACRYCCPSRDAHLRDRRNMFAPGGPLSEGKLKDKRFECPWHGSCFSLETAELLTDQRCILNLCWRFASVRVKSKCEIKALIRPGEFSR